ncbi:ATP-dependent RNA helicase HAS1 [Phytophthora nicotianae]|uniref:ATP-dependent RNA helicase HAS1 n=1 Tax=Phytophthora nicotianae TaxID=4792 RepID=A0A0W8DKD8_PHYNI|nr:ATP-dependent RNA helicase HAS1 [Phytophthora nicotianae]
MKATKKQLAKEKEEKANAGSKKVMSNYFTKLSSTDEGETTSSQRSSIDAITTPERKKKKRKPLTPRDNTDHYSSSRPHDKSVFKKSRSDEKYSRKNRPEDDTAERKFKYDKQESRKRKRSESTPKKINQTDAAPKKSQERISRFFGAEQKQRQVKKKTSLKLKKLLSVALTPPFMELNKMRYELDLPPFRSQHDLFKGARVILNTAFGLEHPQPLSPLVDAVGPIMPVPGGNASKLERQPLPSALLSWLDASIDSTPSLRLRQRSASHRAKSTEHDLETAAGGVVYLNLGTMAYIDAWQAQALVEGLLMGPEDPPVKILWILPTDQRGILPPALPPSLVVKPPSSSLSNLEILSHPAVRLVVSHCGMVSAQEALVMGKPLLCIPFLVDQPDVAARVEDSGAGISLDKNLLSGPYVHGAVTPWHKTALLDVWAVYAALICLLAVFVRVQWLLLYFLVSESFSLLCNLILGPPLPLTSMAEGYDEEYEDDAEGIEGNSGGSDTSQPTN